MDNFQLIFKDLYYDLYTNSNVSSAEKLISEFGFLINIKVIDDRENQGELIESFLKNEITKSELIKVICLMDFPLKRKKIDLSDKAMKKFYEKLRPYCFSNNVSHIVGEAFQSLIGSNLRGDKGQFFTPRTVGECMVTILEPKCGQKIIDPALGPGGFLVEIYDYLINFEQNVSGTELIGIEKDPLVADLALNTLSIIDDSVFSVKENDSLKWYAEKIIKNQDIDSYDIVITNPPFGANIKVNDSEILKAYEFGYLWKKEKNSDKWTKQDKLLYSQDPQILFVELAVKLLKPGGKMGIVLPEGVFGNINQGFVWEYLKSQGSIYALIDCPRTTFQPSTDTKTNILFFEKGSKRKKTNIGIAYNSGNDRRGRYQSSDGSDFVNDFNTLKTTYHKGGDLWVNTKLVGEYMVPRYHFNKENKKVIFDKNTITIGEMIKKGYLTIRKGHEVGSEAYGTGDIPFIRTSDINNLEIRREPTNSIHEDIYNKYKSLQDLKEGDILFVYDGRYRIGNVAMINKFNKKCVVQSHLKILTLTSKAPFTPYEFLYLLNQPETKEQIRSLIFIQTTLGTIGKRLEEIVIPITGESKEWIDKIDRFEHVLLEREQLLQEITELTTPIEL